MKKNIIEINIIKSLITDHIKNLKDDKAPAKNKEIDYLLVKEAIEAIIREYKKPDDSRQRKRYIKKLIIEVYEELYTYLININRYDYKILELYSMLDNLIYNYEN